VDDPPSPRSPEERPLLESCLEAGAVREAVLFVNGNSLSVCARAKACGLDRGTTFSEYSVMWGELEKPT